jgi:hypothetical protein
MKPVSVVARAAAAAVAVSVSLSLVWGMATLGYPTSVAAASSPAALALDQACAPM